MKYFEDYDRTDPSSIEKYSQGLKGKTFRQIIEETIADMMSQAERISFA